MRSMAVALAVALAVAFTVAAVAGCSDDSGAVSPGADLGATDTAIDGTEAHADADADPSADTTPGVDAGDGDAGAVDVEHPDGAGEVGDGPADAVGDPEVDPGGDGGADDTAEAGDDAGSGGGGTLTPSRWVIDPDHFDGTFVQGDFRSIWMHGDALHGVAVGSAGVFHTSDGGSTWTNLSTTRELVEVWGWAADAAVMSGFGGGSLGDSANTYLYDGAGVTRLEGAGGNHIVYDIAGSGAGNVLQVGYTYRDGLGGTMYRWRSEAAAWELVRSSVARGVYTLGPEAIFETWWDTVHVFYDDIDGYDAANVWVVGTGGRIMKFNGGAWVAQDSGVAVDLWDVFAADFTHAWAVGDAGTIVAWNGTSWSLDDSPSDARWWGLGGVDADSVWVAGEHGRIATLTGAGWALQTDGNSANLYDVSAAPGSAVVWAAGGKGRVVRFDGEHWANHAVLEGELYAVWASSDEDVFVGGDAGVFHYDGVAWAPETIAGVGRVTGLWAADADHVWAVDAAGGIFFRDAGGDWSPQSSGVATSLNAVWGSGSDSVWAVGDHGVILRRSAGLWQPQVSSTTRNLYDVEGVDDSRVWAVGDWATAVELREGVWTRLEGIPHYAFNPLRALHVVAGDAVYVVGDDVLRYDGEEWQVLGRNLSGWAIGGSEVGPLFVLGGDRIYRGVE
jgi:hypothetical protein